ncbi:3-hydroxyacyl-CoA dehydrogenase family protein [Lentzea sp. BCCO 10_0856]|uniref:3-hydroxyacyl-CoA dehydrogenase family protein n=1 Tax=Lentzea miocenica TaxID=3095431 RepID=A0ABU4T392_9PSEU|nr:3-hydroxyacyl-CoA dehydrogenase family protein [Lentzea sp. BCCO 10_0856]MDX8032624.1 3-hydroxyacyl-CoA dehydrogenase family protein [Lentzea sp. BCCO 10_0856]
MTVPAVVGVYGGGRMGAGIAHAFAVAGSAVTVVENDDRAAAAARARVEKSLAKSVELGMTVTGTVEVVTGPEALATASLVIEAVPELPEVKHAVLATVARCAPDAAIGTNASSLPIDALAGALPDPSVLIGLHFFNPVPASDLVEVVVGARTAPELVVRAQEWVEGLGKHAITVRDSPGFASSRLGVAIALEAIRMVEEGVATAEDIDNAMTLGYRHPVGPLRTTDIVGLDVRLAIAEHLSRELGPRFAPPQVLRDEVAAGHLGRKTGEGFYRW